VPGDPLLLAQALGNLIDNALKYAGDGACISVGVGTRGEGTVEIAVADSGPGISDEDKLKVTERFYRCDASRGTPGMGLGLSLVEAVARLHGGHLMLKDNHPGLCAVMVLDQSRLPSRAREAEPASTLHPPASAATASEPAVSFPRATIRSL
jgi:signal transduction histidine kinase